MVILVLQRWLPKAVAGRCSTPRLSPWPAARSRMGGADRDKRLVRLSHTFQDRPPGSTSHSRANMSAARQVDDLYELLFHGKKAPRW